MTPEMRLNPFPLYAMMREAGGMLHIEQHRVWNVFRYRDVRTVLTDHARFSSEHEGQGYGPSSLITTDPPRHTQLRSLISRAFSPRSIVGMERRIEELARQMLERVHVNGEFDLVAELAAPLPVMVIAEMLGIPTEDRTRFKHWSDQVVASADVLLMGQQAVDAHESGRAMWDMAQYFRRIISERRSEPRDDLISQMIAAEIEGERLSEQDILNFCWLLLVAGNETTTNLITNAVITLLEHPEDFERLRGDRALLSSAIEEVLRYRSPVQAMFRTTRTEVEIAGQRVPAGERIIAWIGSANRDGEQFPDPDTFLLDRDPNPHIAFGHGIHFCLGAPLARLEARVALTALLDHLVELRRANDLPLEPVKGFIVHGVTSLPLQFSRAMH